MAYVMINSWVATLTASLSSGATVLPVSSAQVVVLASLLGANTTTLELSDGVYTEIVNATITGGTTVTIVRGQEGTTARAFAAGSCAKATLTAAGLAQLVCATNCGCDPIKLRAGDNLSSPQLGVEWTHSWFFTGTHPFILLPTALPFWATFDETMLNQGLLTVRGTATTPDTDVAISFVITGCSGSHQAIDERVDVCAPTGLAG